jgi:uncharacterized membrane protein
MLHEKKNILQSRAARVVSALVLALMLALVPFAGFTTAKADGGLTLSTPYPGITVSPGDSVTFALTVKNESGAPQNVALSFETPEGWDAYFEGGDNPVTRVYVDNASGSNTVAVNLIVKMPDDVAEGPQTITAKAEGAGGAVSTLQLDVNVSKTEFTKGNLTAQFQEQEGASSSTFDFSMSLANKSSKSQSYSLSAQAPDGWKVSFSNSDGLQIASLNLEASRTQAIAVSIEPASDAAAGDYTIPVTATSASETLSLDFKVTITGTYAMTLSTPSGLLSVDAMAGKGSAVTLTITNSGTAELKNVTLSTASVPTDWSVEFDTTTIPSIAVGESAQVTATIKAASDAINGDYEVDIKAKADESSSTAAFRVTVKTSTVWGIVGIAVVAVVVVALVFVFRKFGRR